MVIAMEDIFNKSILYDLYGGLLSDNQKNVYEYHIIDDLSFSEIGEELGISRQAAYDLFKNADRKLINIDKKLQLSTRLRNVETLADEINKLSFKNSKIKNLSNKIINIVKGGNE